MYFNRPKKKMRREDEDESPKRAPGLGMKNSVDESKEEGSMYGNKKGGSAYPEALRAQYAKGRPRTVPGYEQKPNRLNESKMVGGDHYGNEGMSKGNAKMKKSEHELHEKRRRKDVAVAMLGQKMKKRY